jgi:hypothetical protein
MRNGYYVAGDFPYPIAGSVSVRVRVRSEL